MIRFRLAELIADAQFKSGRRVTLLEIAQATGINRMTLSRMSNVRGYSTSTDTLDKLCKYFGCDVGDIAGYVADETVSAQSNTGKAAAKRKEKGGRASSSRKPARRAAKAA